MIKHAPCVRYLHLLYLPLLDRITLVLLKQMQTLMLGDFISVRCWLVQMRFGKGRCLEKRSWIVHIADWWLPRRILLELGALKSRRRRVDPLQVFDHSGEHSIVVVKDFLLSLILSSIKISDVDIPLIYKWKPWFVEVRIRLYITNLELSHALIYELKEIVCILLISISGLVPRKPMLTWLMYGRFIFLVRRRLSDSVIWCLSVALLDYALLELRWLICRLNSLSKVWMILLLKSLHFLFGLSVYLLNRLLPHVHLLILKLNAAG